MASNYPEFDDRDRQIHTDGEILIAQMTANRDQLEAFHRDARGRRKKEYEQHLAAADKCLFEFRSSHEVFTEHLIERGVVPESKRGRPVLENDTRTNAQKLGVPENSPVLGALRKGNGNQNQPGTGTPPGNEQPAASSEAASEAAASPGPAVPAKSLPPGTSSMLRAAKSSIRDNPDEGVPGAVGRGFLRGVLTGAQAGVSARTGRGGGDQAETDTETPARRRNRPAPETRQPPSLDVIDVIQGNPTPGVVMDPGHIAGLKALEGNGDDGLESGGAGYTR